MSIHGSHESLELELQYFFKQSGGPVSAPTGHQKNRAGNERKSGSFTVPAELMTVEQTIGAQIDENNKPFKCQNAKSDSVGQLP